MNSNFHVPLLMTRIMEKHIVQYRTKSCPTVDTQQLQDVVPQVEPIVLDALKKMLLFKCYSGEEYEQVLQQCADLLTMNSDISLIAIDGISTFYWSDFDTEDRISMDEYLKTKVLDLRLLVAKHKLVAIYARPTEFGTWTSAEDRYIDYKIHLECQRRPVITRKAQNFFSKNSITRTFVINKYGVEWQKTKEEQEAEDFRNWFEKEGTKEALFEPM